METFYVVTLSFAGVCVFGIGYFVGRMVEMCRSRTRGVTLSEFHRMTQSR